MRAAARAGPKARAGFMAAPVNGPMARMSAATVRPMPNPPIFGARGSTAVPQTAVTRKKVAMSSARKEPKGSLLKVGVPAATTAGPKEIFGTN